MGSSNSRVPGYNYRTYLRASDIWFHLRSGMEMVFLVWSHLRWSKLANGYLHAGDICTYNPSTKGCEAAEGDWELEDFVAIGSRRPERGREANCQFVQVIPHARIGTYCVVYLVIPGSYLCYLLSLL